MEADQPKFLDIDVKSLEKFKSANAGLAAQAQELLWLEWMLVSLINHHIEAFTAFTSFCMQQVHEYHREAALLCMRGRANTGLALTRMACELSRDILRFARSDDLANRWKSLKAGSPEYRRFFKFKEDSPAEKGLFDIYKIASAYGIHGHIWFPDRDPVANVMVGERDHVMLRSSPTFIVDCMLFNLGSIQLSILAFLDEHCQVFIKSTNPDLITYAKQLVKDILAVKLSWKDTVTKR